MKSKSYQAPEHDQTLVSEKPTLLSIIIFWLVLLALMYTCGLHAMAKYDKSYFRVEVEDATNGK
jgi:hypothetical protein